MTTDDLTPTSRRSVSYYRDMAAACHRSAAIERAQAHSGDPDARLTHARKADELDVIGDQWAALADELEDFASDGDHPGQEALL